MCSRFPEAFASAVLAATLALAESAACAQPVPAMRLAPLRVCVDPDNMPYSRADGAGYEPKVAQILADELKRPLELHWQPMRRGMVRKTLGEHQCDVLMSVPAGLGRVLTTRPYYRSSYVFVTPADDPSPLSSFDDPRLARLRIGVQLIGNDLAASPPGVALVRHGAVDGVRGFTVDGGSAPGEGPAGQRMVQALERGELDAAIAWGPQVGWFARRAARPLKVALASPPADVPVPFQFGMAVAVRKDDVAVRDQLQQALQARRAEIDAVLAEYAVPRVEAMPAQEVGR